MRTPITPAAVALVVALATSASARQQPAAPAQPSSAICLGLAMGGPAPPGVLCRAITKIRGDVYRAQYIRHKTVFVVTPDGVILGDPISLDAATWLKQEIAQRFRVPVRYVLYSHSHWDHASGARVFDDTAELWGHANMPAAIREESANLPANLRSSDRNGDRRLDRSEAQGETLAEFDALDRNRNGFVEGIDWMIDVVPPEKTYTGRHVISLGGKRVEMIHPGGAQHSNDATVLYFPDERVVHVVDFVSIRRAFASALDPATQTVAGWIDSFKAVEALDFDLAAPGHGLIGTKADVTLYREYFEELAERVAAGLRAGRTIEQLQASDMLERFSWLSEYSTRRDGNIADMYRFIQASRRN